MLHLIIAVTCYHTRYRTFSVSLLWFGAISNSLSRITIKFTCLRQKIFEQI